MLLEVLHETRYTYSPAVEHAQHIACLQPAAQPHQALLQHALHIAPAPAQQRQVSDSFGNTRLYFALHHPHEALVVTAHSQVQTRPPTAWQAAPTVAWEQVWARHRYRAGAAWEAASEFVFASPCAPHDAAFAEFARPSFAAGRPVAEAAWDLMQRIHRHMRYQAHSTDVHTPARQALAQGHGVCQDFAHILVACCRSLGLPARYVSGYLLTTPPLGQSRLVGSDASHAWAEVYCPWADPAHTSDGSPGFWLALDPTNNRSAGEDYVTLATGRDFLDVSPLRGVIRGGARHALSVAVTVRPVDALPAGSAGGPRTLAAERPES